MRANQHSISIQYPRLFGSQADLQAFAKRRPKGYARMSPVAPVTIDLSSHIRRHYDYLWEENGVAKKNVHIAKSPTEVYTICDCDAVPAYCNARDVDVLKLKKRCLGGCE